MDEVNHSELNAFSADTDLRGDVVIVRVAGELDLLSAPTLRLCLAEAVAIKAPPRIVVDIAALTFCDSTGLGALLRAQHLIQEAKGGFALVGVRDRLARMLRVTGLDKTFRMHVTIDEATDDLIGGRADDSTTR